jgi:hypothetical protein
MLMTDDKPARKKLPWRRKFVDQLLSRDELADRLLADSPPSLEEEEHRNAVPPDPAGLPEADVLPEMEGDWEGAPEVEENAWSAADAQLYDYLDDQEAFEQRAFEQVREMAGTEPVLNRVKYRWEFMRRSRAYRAAYQRHRDISEREADLPERLKKFEWWESFGLLCSEPPDPDLSFEELMVDERFQPLEDPLFRLGVISRNDPTEAAVSFFTYRNDAVDFHRFDRIRLEVDLQQVRDIESLNRLITHILEDHWQHYAKRHRRRKSPAAENDYEQMLRIGDLKDRQGMNYRQIAEQLFPQDPHPGAARRRVARCYRMYRKLVDGGYKQLGLP